MDISSLRERGSIGTFTVSELNGYIKRIFENDRTLTGVSVKGEISNFINHRSGHLYFSLKDAEGQIRAVMFKSSAMRLKFIPENGMKVILFGSVSVYQKDGSYQLYVNSMEPDGIGALYLAYERLKEKLSLEGLFSEEYKKPIPQFPEKIGVITSPSGAAVRDIINVTGRRFPVANLYIYPSLVQGEGAEDNLIEALEYFEKSRLVDVIIIGRGGGSIEDLWAFNGERLARKIFEASIPIISAVGHETDFTICDFVADLRAPTPSAAAELAVPDIRELAMRLDGAYERSSSALIYMAERWRERLTSLINNSIFRCDEPKFLEKKNALDNLKEKIIKALEINIMAQKSRFMPLLEKANALNPLSVLARGYTIVEKNSKLVRSVRDLGKDDEIKIRLSDGDAVARIEKITKTGILQ